MKKYSVLLLYPDYVADNYGQDTYFAWVEAGDYAKAVMAARRDCMDEHEDIQETDDLYPLLVIEGHHKDVFPHNNPEVK